MFHPCPEVVRLAWPFREKFIPCLCLQGTIVCFSPSASTEGLWPRSPLYDTEFVPRCSLDRVYRTSALRGLAGFV